MAKNTVPNEVWNAAAGMLSAYMPGITPEQVKDRLTPKPGESEFERPLTRFEVRDLLGVSLNTVHRLMRAGKLEKIKINRTSRITAASVRALMSNVQ